MRKSTVLVTIIVLCVWAFSGIAHATPSTLIWIPSTDIQAAGQTHFGSDVYAPSTGSALTDIGVTLGTGKVEYGLDYLSQTGIKDPVRLNVKALIKDETAGAPRLAVGAFDVGGVAASNMVYLLGSKTFHGTRATLGWCAGDGTLGRDKDMILLGVDRAFSPKWWGAVDYQSGKSAFGALSAGVSYNFTPSRSLILGYDWYNDSGLSDTVTMQLDVNF